MKDGSNESKLMKIYLEENYVGFGWEEFGDLENVSEAEFTSKAYHSLNTVGAKHIEWMRQLEDIITFVYCIQDGDYIVIASEGLIHVGDIGDYYYVNGLDDKEINSSHRRGVTWLKSVPLEQISEELHIFVSQQANISKFDQIISYELLESWLEVNKSNHDVHTSIVDKSTIEEALNILKAAMHSDDVERRERAAIAILQYVK